LGFPPPPPPPPPKRVGGLETVLFLSQKLISNFVFWAGRAPPLLDSSNVVDHSCSQTPGTFSCFRFPLWGTPPPRIWGGVFFVIFFFFVFFFFFYLAAAPFRLFLYFFFFFLLFGGFFFFSGSCGDLPWHKLGGLAPPGSPQFVWVFSHLIPPHNLTFNTWFFEKPLGGFFFFGGVFF